MSTSYKSPPGPEPNESQPRLEHESEQRLAADLSVREMAESIPEELSEIAKDISRMLEQASVAEAIVAVKVSVDARVKLDQLVECGVFRTKAEAAAFLIDEGFKTQESLVERGKAKPTEIEQLRAELRSLLEESAADTKSGSTSMRPKDDWDQTDPHWLVGLSAGQLGTGLLLVKESSSDEVKKINQSSIGYLQFRTFAVSEHATAMKWIPHTIADETTVLSLKCDGYCQRTCVRPGCICDSNRHRCV